ncbi:MAG: hypothetical protein K0Q83_3667 [Deltaproteobacteria bacterium]|jgi:hypothetical protein|nr:hypothetical protein [Deltaproteobacteria bacterium]
MKFDVYGRFRLEVQRENDSWVVYGLPLDKRVRATDLIVPSTLKANEIARFLDDIFMSYPHPGKASSYCRKSRRKCFYEVF